MPGPFVYWKRLSLAYPSWPGVSGPPIPAHAATGGPDKPNHDEGGLARKKRERYF